MIYSSDSLSSYPSSPVAGTRKPLSAPRTARGDPIQASQSQPDDGSDGFDGAPLNDGPDWTPAPGFVVPGCSDRDGSLAIVSKPPTPNQPRCDDKNSLSGVPYNLFNGQQSNIYTTFCSAADGNERALSWYVNATGGGLLSTVVKTRKRTPPPNINAYQNYLFDLSWKPIASYNRSACIQTCVDAFIAITDSPCGRQGSKYCND
jgi:hypothetical protein